MSNKKGFKLKRFKLWKTRDHNLSRLLVFFAIVFVAFSIIPSRQFLQWTNILNMAKQVPILGFLTISMALAMITGGIDLSIVYIANLSGILSGLAMISIADASPNIPPFIIVLLGTLVSLTIGLFLGAFNGFLVSGVGITPILATLGTSQIFLGLAIVITDGKAVSGWTPALSGFLNASLGNFFPVTLLIFIISIIFVSVLLRKTRYGRRVYMLGTNVVAARYAGIRINSVIIRTYALGGLMAALAGMVIMSSANSAKADYGIPYTMQAILVTVLAGFSPSGGRGKISSIVVAVAILQVLSSGLNMFENVSNFYRDLIWGLALITVLIYNYYSDRRALRQQTLEVKEEEV